MTLITKRKSLREIAKLLEDSSQSPTPGNLASRIMAQISPADYEHYLREAIGTLAIGYKIDFRRSAFKDVVATSRGAGRAGRVSLPRERVQIFVDPLTGEETRQENPEYAQAKSHKAYLIKSEWDAFLERNLPTGDEKRPYILIKDATVADLRHAAALRRSLAAANEAEAKKYDALATLMTQKHAATLGLLSAADVKGML